MQSLSQYKLTILTGILLLLGVFLFSHQNQQQKAVAPAKITRKTPLPSTPPPLTSQRTDQTLDATDHTIQSTLDDTDSDLKQLDTPDEKGASGL